MKFKYQSDWVKRQRSQDLQDEEEIRQAMYTPNEEIIYKGRRFCVAYAEVREGALVYLLHGRKTSYWVPQALLLAPDQI